MTKNVLFPAQNDTVEEMPPFDKVFFKMRARRHAN